MIRFDSEQRCGLCGKRCRDHQDRVAHERDCEQGIRTANIRPPIGTTQFDWSATLADYDGAPDAGFQPVGYGPTRDAAIADLKNEIEEHQS